MLKHKKCIPCEDKTGLLDALQIKNLLDKVNGWTLEEKSNEISKIFPFFNFVSALDFINRVGEIAEDESHHPDILLFGFNKVKISLSTHSVNGLTENDFILASKIDSIQ